MRICTCGYGRPGETCLGNRSDCFYRAPCVGGAFEVDPRSDFRRAGGAAGGLCSVCGKEPREHPTIESVTQDTPWE